MFEPGRICIKIAGRDAGRKCVVVEAEKDSMVLVDGETRRRKCNVRHLEPLDQTVSIKAGASHADVITAFKKLGVELRDTKAKKAAARPRRVHKQKTPKEEPAKPVKKAKGEPVKQASPEPAKESPKPHPITAEVTKEPVGETVAAPKEGPAKPEPSAKPTEKPTPKKPVKKAAM